MYDIIYSLEITVGNIHGGEKLHLPRTFLWVIQSCIVFRVVL